MVRTDGRNPNVRQSGGVEKEVPHRHSPHTPLYLLIPALITYVLLFTYSSQRNILHNCVYPSHPTCPRSALTTMESAQTSSASATNPAAASSIASLLYHDGPAHEADNHGLIDYLQSHGDYANDINHYHAQPSHGHSQRSPSPPDPSIPIPSSLNRLANTALAHYMPPALPPLPGAIDQAAVAAAIDYGDRGEMGGKRRKLPHQRAGWADMENSQNKKRRTRKSEDAPHLVGSNAGGSASPAGSQRASAGVQGEVQIPAGQDLSSLTELSRMALEGVTGDTLQTQEVQEPKPQQATHEIDPTLAPVHEPRPAPPPEPPM